MDIGWDDLRLFLAVAEAGSVSAGARRLRVGQATVSRRLQQLEHVVGAKLFRRSVEGVAITTAGERLLKPARKMAELAGEAGRATETRDRAPRGLVRITSTPLVSFQLLAPFAALVARRHPGLRLEVLSGMAYLDLNRGEAELAIRLRPSENEGLVTLAAVEIPNAVLVSRALRSKLPRKPKLSDVPWITWAPPFEALPPNPFLFAAIPGLEPAFSSDSILVNLAAAEAGVGAFILGYAEHRLVRAHALVPLPIDLGPMSRTPLHLVCARSALDISRVRAVADLLVRELADLATA